MHIFIWIGIAGVFAVIEALTLGITTLWFALGAVVAALVSLTGIDFIYQFIIFLAVSILLLYFTKPLAEKRLKIGSEKTNVDDLPGRSALVVKDIKPFETGQVKVQGQIWTAITEGVDFPVIEGEKVEILRIDGVKLVVAPIRAEKGGN